MLLEEMLKKSERKGRSEGKLDGLKISVNTIMQTFGEPVPAFFTKLVEESDDAEFLEDLVKKAMEFKSLDELIEYVADKQ